MDPRGSPRDRRDTDRAASPLISVLVFVSVSVILAGVVGTYVVDPGGPGRDAVRADASVHVDLRTHAITVTWTANTNAAALRVTATGMAGANGAYELQAVGATVVMREGGVAEPGDAGEDILGGAVKRRSEADFDRGDVVTLTVTAVRGDARTVVLTKEALV